MTARRVLVAASVVLNLAVIVGVLVVADRRGIALSDLPTLLRTPPRVEDPGATPGHAASTEDLVRAGRVPVDLVLVGDSHLASVEPHAVWPAGTVVIRRCRGGRTLAGLEASLATEVLPLAPRRAVLLGGQNDLRFALRDGADPEAAVAAARDATTRIVAALRERGARVVLVEPPPVAVTARGAVALNAAVADLAARLAEQAAATDGVDWCPWPAELVEDGALRADAAPDGVHLGPAARAVLGEALRAAVGLEDGPDDGNR